MKNSIYDINYLWILFVILHMSGATLLMIFYGIPYLYLILLNAMMFVFMIYTAKTSHVSLVQHLKIKVPDGKEIVFVLCITVFLFIMAGYVNALSLLFASDHTASVLDGAADHFIMVMITYAVIPAIVEEMMFRGCILRGTSNKIIGLIVSTITFALLHGNLNQICYALFMGLTLGIIALLTENLTVTILIHFLFNAISIVGAAFENSPLVTFLNKIEIGGYAIFSPEMQSDGIGASVAIGFLVFLIAGVIAYFIMRFFYKEKLTIIFEKEPYAIENLWTPDWKFLVGCFLCIGIAYISK